MANAFVSMCILSIVTNFYPTKQIKFIGYVECVSSAGYVMGPFLGTIFYTLFGYRGMLFAFGFMFLLIATILTFVLTNKIDRNTNLDTTPQVKKESFKIPKIKLLRNSNFFMLGLAAGLNYISYDFMIPVLSLALSDLKLS